MLHFLRPLPSARPVYVLCSSFLDSSFGLIGDLGFFSSTYLVHFSSITLNYTVLQSLTPYLLDCEVSSSPYFLARWLVRRSQRMLAVWRRKHRNTSIPFTRLNLFKLLSVSLQLLSFIDPFLFALSFPSHLQPFQGAHLNFLEVPGQVVKPHSLPCRDSSRQRADVTRSADVPPSGPPAETLESLFLPLIGAAWILLVKKQRVPKVGRQGFLLPQRKVICFPERRACSRGPAPERRPRSPGERRCTPAAGWERACAGRGVCWDPR